MLLLGLLGMAARIGHAQDTAAGPIYIVESGDTLFTIAQRFGVTVDDLVETNNLANANTLLVGDRLVIPGLEGIVGILETTEIVAGDNLRGLSRLYRIPMNLFIRLNRLVSPAELYLGSSLVLTRGQLVAEPYRLDVGPGESVLEASVRGNANPWNVSHWNGYEDLIAVHPGDVLLVDRPGDAGPAGLPRAVSAIEISPVFQGETVVIEIAAGAPLTAAGSLGPYPLAFNQADGRLVSLQGTHALLEPAMLPLNITIITADGGYYDYAQTIRMYERGYIFESISVPPALIDPETNQAENALVQPFFDAVSPEQFWSGLFTLPSPFEDCINSTFGNRRSYNGSAFTFYHSGVDFCGGSGVEIFAAADGIVVFAEPLEVRGNFTIIDHGWGVFTSYSHQSEILVQAGDRIEAGEVIGLIGSTGRSTGPHLHFEVWVHGVPVNPLDWLEIEYP